MIALFCPRRLIVREFEECRLEFACDDSRVDVVQPVTRLDVVRYECRPDRSPESRQGNGTLQPSRIFGPWIFLTVSSLPCGRMLAVSGPPRGYPDIRVKHVDIRRRGFV